MTLQQMYDLANRRSYFSRPAADLWDALNYGAGRVYQWVVKEMSGYFVKWDTASVQLQAGVDEYPFPADLGKLIRMRETTNPATDYWRVMVPTQINANLFVTQQIQGLIWPQDDPVSPFAYVGPYLPASVLQNGKQVYGVEQYNFKVAPIPQESRAVELFYAAKFLEITNAQSPLMIPTEGHQAVLAFAIAELLRGNNDNLAQEYEQRGAGDTTLYLTYVRNRQEQQPEAQQTYLDVMD